MRERVLAESAAPRPAPPARRGLCDRPALLRRTDSRHSTQRTLGPERPSTRLLRGAGGAVAPGRLGGVERLVGRGEQRGGVHVPGVADGDADRGSERQRALSRRDRGVREPAAEPLAERVCLFGAGVGSKDQELLVSEPREYIARAWRRRDATRRVARDVVADGVAEAVVDLLEVVEVDQRDGK